MSQNWYKLVEPTAFGGISLRRPQFDVRALINRFKIPLVGPAFLGLVFFAICTVVISASFHRGYQDSWILEGIWIPLLLTFVCYLATFYQTSSLVYVAMGTSIMVFVGYAAPGLKYSEIYSSTIDASVHYSMIRTLTTTGLPDPNAYEFTPGMHILIAAFSQMSGYSPIFWSKVLPGFIGSLAPLGIYELCRQANLPISLSKIVIAVSGVSLSLLYVPNGTTFAVAIVSSLFTTMIIREIALYRPEPSHAISYGILILLMLMTLILWHAISSILIPAALVVSGISALALWRFFAAFGNQFSRLRISAISLITTGIIGLYMLALYWSMVAEPLWDYLLLNVRLFAEALTATEIDPSETLVPQRASEIPLWALFRVFMFMHARDGTMLLLAFLGIGFSFESIWRKRQEERPFLWLLFFCIVLLMSFSLIFVGTFVSGFSKHGYQRFMRYMIVASPVVAGYGLWRILGIFNIRRRYATSSILATAGVAALYLVASIQLYPYQPATPTAEIVGGDATTPILWQHQVNTDYQQRVLEFSLEKLDPSLNFYSDYVTYHQSGLFLGLEAKEEISYRKWTREQPAYVILHEPGKAGSYAEQAEYRSQNEIEKLREIDGVTTIYDNGGSFMLFVPQEQMSYYTLGNQ